MLLHNYREMIIYIAMMALCLLGLVMAIEKESIRVYQKYGEEKNLNILLEKQKQNRMDAMQDQRKSMLQTDNSLLDTSDVLAYLTRYFTEQNIQVKTIQMLKVKAIGEVNILPVKISAEGQFSEFIHWIVSLMQGPRVVAINDFSFQRDEHGIVTADIQLLIWGLHAKALNTEDLESSSISVKQLGEPVSLKQMKWGGIFLEKNKRMGFLILPDDKVLEIKAGEVIGMEKGIVVAIQENEISIRVANQMIKIKPVHS